VVALNRENKSTCNQSLGIPMKYRCSTFYYHTLCSYLSSNLLIYNMRPMPMTQATPNRIQALFLFTNTSKINLSAGISWQIMPTEFVSLGEVYVKVDPTFNLKPGSRVLLPRRTEGRKSESGSDFGTFLRNQKFLQRWLLILSDTVILADFSF
jgi:hypothetical protein